MAKQDTSGNNVAENAPKNGAEVETLRPYERMVKQLQGIAKLESDNGSGFEIAANVVDKMLAAETLDDILAAGKDGPLKAEDMEHKPFLVRELSIHKAADAFADGGFGVYYVVACSDAVSLADKVFSVGATNVVAALFAMDQKGVFETDENPTLVIRSRPTPNGKLFYLERA